MLFYILSTLCACLLCVKGYLPDGLVTWMRNGMTPSFFSWYLIALMVFWAIWGKLDRIQTLLKKIEKTSK